MAEPDVFEVRGGLPWSRQVRITGGTTIWATLDSFEARMHIRVEKDFHSRLKYDFTPHLVPSIDGADIVIRWDLTGAQTALLKSGYYDLIVSDPGDIDSRGFPVIEGRIEVDPIVTAVGGTS